MEQNKLCCATRVLRAIDLLGITIKIFDFAGIASRNNPLLLRHDYSTAYFLTLHTHACDKKINTQF